jgi:murein L,D-transpeptidase YafK
MRKSIFALSAVGLALLILLAIANRPIDKLSAGSKADNIIALKSQHTMTLYSGNRPLKTYKVALGRGPGNAKHREGDHETPEGHYILDSRNAHSRFHLALHVSYPNAHDQSAAKAQGTPPGGNIMIHGIGPGLGWLGRLQHTVDWTDGCIALTNPEIEEVWNAVPTGTPIEIRH